MPEIPDDCYNNCVSVNNNYGEGSYLKINESRELEICACDPWNWRGIKVGANEKYLFNYGKPTEAWIDGGIPSDPEKGWLTWHRYLGSLGWFFRRVPREPWYVLIGTINKNEEENFKINSDTEYTTKSDGPLYIYANDAISKYGNNKGKLMLSIKRIK